MQAAPRGSKKDSYDTEGGNESPQEWKEIKVYVKRWSRQERKMAMKPSARILVWTMLWVSTDTRI